MPTRVFLTIDTELMWGHHARGLPLDEIVARSLEPAGVGVGYQLRQLRDHGLKACFFVDPMPALVFGIEPIRRVVGDILGAGQEVQLHLHPNWTRARAGDRGRARSEFELSRYDYAAQRALIAQAAELLISAGAPPPVAFRAGCYAANDDTLRALADLGLQYDSSHNGAEHPDMSAISLPADQIAPVEHLGVVEVPVTVIEDKRGQRRHFQICALSAGEMRAALDHAVADDHAAVTIVSHGFELAVRAGTRPNSVHVRRFLALCRMLDARRDVLVTSHFRREPELALDSADTLLEPSLIRTGLRQVEQLWSNWVAERPA